MNRLIISLLAALALLLPAGLQAQTATGSWEIIPTFGSPTRVIDTPQTVWILTSTGSLIGYDKETTELAAYNRNNRLNGNVVAGIWYNPERKYLIVVHKDLNIDIVYDEGRTVNVGDLMFATTDMGTVFDVSFHGNNAYLATSAGMVILNAERGLISQTCYTSGPLAAIAVTDNWIFAEQSSNGNIVRAPLHGNHALNLFKSTNAAAYANSAKSQWGNIMPLDDDKLLLVDANQDVAVATFDAAKLDTDPRNSATVVKIPNVRCVYNRMNITKDGYTAQNASYISYINRDGSLKGQTAHNVASLNSTYDIFANWNSSKPEELWRVTSAGLGQWNATNKAYTKEPFKPVCTSGTNVGQFAAASDGRIYIANIGITQSTYGSLTGTGTACTIDIIYPDGSLKTVSTGVKAHYCVIANPKNPDEIVIGGFNGLYRYNVAEKKLTTYDPKNSYIGTGSVRGVTFDTHGNLWVTESTKSPSGQQYIRLIPEKEWNSGQLTSDIIKEIGVQEYRHSTRLDFLPIGPGYLATRATSRLILIDLNGTYEDVSDDKVAIVDWNNDQDGLSMAAYNLFTFAVDKNNWTWIGTDSELAYYSDIKKAFTSSPEPARPKVPRNDGTDLADYLCNNVDVYWVAVDENNHKWIATAGSGLYRANEDGTEILDHFTTDNSEIPTNNVMAVYPDPNSNKVYVGTELGLSILRTNSSPSKPNYKEVYAYPNPVTPEYTGYITIAGLMKDSLVKIADAAGRTFYEATSDGGSVIWDGCDGSGNRVKSGVYFVYASQKDGSAATVTKIVVVN